MIIAPHGGNNLVPLATETKEVEGMDDTVADSARLLGFDNL